MQLLTTFFYIFGHYLWLRIASLYQLKLHYCIVNILVMQVHKICIFMHL